MSVDILINHLKRAGWSDFAPGDFLSVSFDQIGKARVAKNNWFVLLKSVPVLGETEIETWNSHYARFQKQSQAGMFNWGKYFILILLAGTIGADGLARLAKDGGAAFLDAPKEILRGGGYALLLIADRKRVVYPEHVTLSKLVGGVEFAKQTHQALEDYRNSLS